MGKPLETTRVPAAAHRHLAFGVLLATGAQIAPLAAAIGVSLTIAHLSGPSGTGVLSLVVTLFNVALLVSGVGLSAGIIYLVSRGEWPLLQASRETRSAAVGLGTVGAVCGIAFYVLTRHTIFKGVTPPVAILSLASLPFALLWSFSAAAALGRDRYEAYVAVQIMQPLVFLFVGVALALVFGLVGAIAGLFAAHLLTAATGWLWIRREVGRERQTPLVDDPATSQLRRATRFGLQAWAANVMQLLSYRLDLFVLSALASRSAVGVYSIAVSVTALGWLLPDALQTVLFPRVASLDAATDAGRMTARVSDASAARAIRHTVLIVVPTALAVAALLLLVPVLYGSGFQQSITLGFILIPGVAALGIAKVISAVLSGRGSPRFSVYTAAITTPISLALYLILIPQFHAIGAAIASTISYVVTIGLSVVFLRKVTVVPLREALLPSRSDIADYVDAFRIIRARMGR